MQGGSGIDISLHWHITVYICTAYVRGAQKVIYPSILK